MEKILVIRLSSFGDIVQSLVVLESLKQKFPNSEIHWLVRSEFKALIKNHPLIDQVHSLDKGSKFSALYSMYKHLKKENFQRVYDAHNNTRSNLLSLLFWKQKLLRKIKWLERPKNRFKRFLLFKFRINLFPWPFVLMQSYLKPLKAWNVDTRLSKEKHIYLSAEVKDSARKHIKDLKEFVVLAPSAAWELKRWPIEYWIELSNQLRSKDIVFLGGPEDTFIQTEIIDHLDTNRSGKVLNLSGKLSFAESCSIIEYSSHVVGGDSGLTHVGDSFFKDTYCIIGAAAFAYPARESTHTLDFKVKCKPCSKDGRGKCTNQNYKACLYGTKPESISSSILRS